jgi:prolipoprotein diacylglyceryltransferase
LNLNNEYDKIPMSNGVGAALIGAAVAYVVIKEADKYSRAHPHRIFSSKTGGIGLGKHLR